MMLNNETFYNMRFLIILQHFVGIKRSYLLESSRQKLLCNIILVIFLSTTFASIAYDGLFSNIPLNYCVLTFLLFLYIETTYLLCTALFQRKTFEAIRMLDEKCVFVEDCSSIIETKSFTIIILTIVTLILDFILMWKIRLSLSSIVLLTVAYAVHDTEMGFYTILISGINLKLSSIAGLNVDCGSKVYRHVLLMASHVQREFNFSVREQICTVLYVQSYCLLKNAFASQILLALGVTFMSTVVYCLVVFVIDSPVVRICTWLNIFYSIMSSKVNMPTKVCCIV